MKKETIFFLVIIIIGIGLIIWTFFGGKGDGNIINNEDPNFIEIINNTGDVQDSDNTGNTVGNSDQINITQPETGTDTAKGNSEIRIMMPRYFYNTGRSNFVEDLYNEQKIQINFIFADNLNSYRDSISDSEFSGADLYLFPYDWHETVKTLQFSPMNDIEGLYDDLVSPFVKSKKIGFLPFSADPMIMYSSVDLPYNNFYGISSIAYSRESNIRLAFPIFFGITNEDYNNQGFTREYQDIVRYALIHYFKKYKDSNYLGLRINSNIQNSDEFRNYNITDLTQIANTITQPECKDYPSICFQLYNFVGIRFGFLSDKDIVQTYFSRKKSNFETLLTYSMPYSSESPIRLWGLGISDKISDANVVNAINIFLVQYMNNHDKYDLRNSTLSVFKKDSDSLSSNQYIGSNGYILETGGNYIETLRNLNSFRQLIEHQISASIFLK